MRAIQYHGSQQPLVLNEIPAPEPGSGQMLLRVEACGICGSDLHAYQAAHSSHGTVFGHEFAGEVVATGPGADEHWSVGDRAISLGALSCRQCEACMTGRFADCQQPELIGFSRDGAYAEYVIVQAANCIHVPEGLSPGQAALVEPFAVGLAALRDAKMPLASNVLVVGAGIIGITALKWARFFGAEHIGVSDLAPVRLQRALDCGATVAIDARETSDPVQAFVAATGTEPQVIIECTGRPILQQLIEAAPRNAHLVVVGAGMEPEPIVSVVASQKKLKMTFSFGYTLEDFAFIIRMIDRGRIDAEGLITATVTLEQAPGMFAELLGPNDHCKVMITP